LGTAPSADRVLVVEDEQKISDAIAEGLRAAGYEVSTAPTSEEAFFILHNLKPDLIVLDLGLPRRSGMELLQQIRSMSIQIPVLILTSNSSIEDRVAALDAFFHSRTVRKVESHFAQRKTNDPYRVQTRRSSS
jgi:two-component system copper resistance phosphate regulon response regulator CusR